MSERFSQPLVIATGNPHKVEEFRAIFRSAGIPVVGLRDLPDFQRFHEPEEIGATCEANARIKALSYATQTGRVCLADDSGIEIDALALPDGTPRPGVISSHYSTDGRETGLSRAERDAANNALVLRQLQNTPPARRTARFVCCICIASPTPSTGSSEPPVEAGGVASTNDEITPAILFQTRATFEGRIGHPPRVPGGTSGFGYDPLFLVGPDYLRTGAELTEGEKNAMSHRARAAALATRWLHIDAPRQ